MEDSHTTMALEAASTHITLVIKLDNKQLQHVSELKVHSTAQSSAWTTSDVRIDNRRRQLRSARSRTCVVRRTYSNYGDRCFIAASLKLWNSLPAFQLNCDKPTLTFDDLSGY